MTDLRAAAQQALEALEKTHTQPGCDQWQAERKASVALRAALEQPDRAQKMRDAGYTRRPTLREMAEPEQEQEPVAWMFDWDVYDPTNLGPDFSQTKPNDGKTWTPLYTAPPRREPLSEEELDRLWREPMSADWEHREYARAIEAAHGIKENT